MAKFGHGDNAKGTRRTDPAGEEIRSPLPGDAESATAQLEAMPLDGFPPAQHGFCGVRNFSGIDRSHQPGIGIRSVALAERHAVDTDLAGGCGTAPHFAAGTAAEGVDTAPAVGYRQEEDILEAEVLVGSDQLDKSVKTAFAADLMSDVLTNMKPGGLLLTAQTNPQCIRTAEMSEIAAVVFVRGKQPDAEGVVMAEKLGLPLITSPFGMYQLCGRLDRAGLEPVM